MSVAEAKETKNKAGKSEGKVRTAMFEIDAPKDLEEKFNRAATELGMCVNLFFSRWKEFHDRNGNAEAVLRASREWVPGKKTQMVIKPSEVVPGDLAQSCIQESRDKFTSLGARVISLAFQRFIKTLKGKSAAVNMPQWWAIMCYRQSQPSIAGKLNIPFDKHGSQGTVIVKPADESSHWNLSVRSPFNGERWEMRLLTKKNKQKVSVACLYKMIDGRCQPMGVNLICRDGKWYAMVTYREKETIVPLVDSQKTAYLVPGLLSPWLLAIPGEEFVRTRFCSDGEFLTHQREKLIAEERSRNAAGKFHGTGSHGHGRGRSGKGLYGPKKKWLGIMTSFNCHIARKVYEICVRTGCGRIVIMRPDPDSDFGNKTFLASSGASDSWCHYSWVLFVGRLKNACYGVVEVDDVKCRSAITEESMIQMVNPET